MNMEEAFEFTNYILDATRDHIVAIKIGYPLILKLGLEIIAEVIDSFGGIAIADVKLSDIENTNKLIAEELLEAGFDAVIAHIFQGKDTLRSTIEKLEKEDKGIFIVASMSNPGAERMFKPILDSILNMCLELDVTGVIAPATRPSEIMYVRKKLGDERLILSPGVGAQGGKIRDALSAGADFLIIGRSIYCSDKPQETAFRLAEISYETGV